MKEGRRGRSSPHFHSPGKKEGQREILSTKNFTSKKEGISLLA